MMGQENAMGQGSGVEGRGYQQLTAWRKAHELALASFRVSEGLRDRHRWLANQLVRAAVSVPANIAEGYNRGSLREYIYHLNVARGSLAEVEYYVLFGRDAGLLEGETIQLLTGLVGDAGRPLLGLIRSLQAKDNRPSSRMIREDRVPYGRILDDGEPPDTARDPRPLTPDPDEEVP
jgi:four helix bundle protein